MDAETGDIMIGAVTFKDKLVKEVMTPIEKVHMVNIDDKLNFQTIARIFKSGFSRLPIYRDSKNRDIQGLLFTKDLIFIDPEDDTPVQQFLQVFGRTCINTHPEQKLFHRGAFVLLLRLTR